MIYYAESFNLTTHISLLGRHARGDERHGGADEVADGEALQHAGQPVGLQPIGAAQRVQDDAQGEQLDRTLAGSRRF